MKEYDVIVVGAGPAGLGAAIEAAKAGARCLLLDENSSPGGQLFKQIHKFFGSKEHYAGTRGYAIGRDLLNAARAAGVDFRLDTKVWGIYPDGSVSATDGKTSVRYRGKAIVLATGASENALSFPGCTLPGVITAGAAQTFVNIYNVLPGRRFVVVGSGNVGLIVSYQLMQAGADVLAILEALPQVSGYGVHAAKIKRAGVPILVCHTIVRASGTDTLESVEIAQVDDRLCPIPGTEKTIPCDTVCLAVGLSPRIELAGVSGCKMAYSPALGGVVPAHDENMEATVENLFVAGDLAGIEEASTALDEGRMAGIRAAYKLGFLGRSAYEQKRQELVGRLDILRSGPLGEKRREAKEEIWRAM
ncbi:MAG: FAD-dependent oxidoreductase [Bacillota bacterium]